MARAFCILPSIVLAGCNSADRDLSRTIAFESAAECRLAPKTRRVFGAMIDHNGTSGVPRPVGPVEIVGVGALQPTFSGPDEYGMVHAELPLKGSWHGLTIKGVGQGFVPNSGVAYYRIVFAQPAETVRERLNRMGFDLPPGDEAREFGDGMTEYISIRGHGSGSALECST